MNNKGISIAVLMTCVLTTLPARGSTPLTESVCQNHVVHRSTTPKMAMGFKEVLGCLSADGPTVPVGLSEPGCLLPDSSRLVRGTMIGSVLKHNILNRALIKKGLKDYSPHAAHVAAIIGGKTDSGAFADIGAGGRVKILTAKGASDPLGLEHFAKMKGNFAVNCSWGVKKQEEVTDSKDKGFLEDSALIRKMAKSGKAVFMALGNEGISSDNKYVKGFAALAHEINSSEEYSGTFVLVGNAYQIADKRLVLVGSSNYVNAADEGAEYVLAAWGYQVRSLVGKDKFEEHTGTSMSTPYVTAAYALLQQHFPDMPARAIVAAILEGAGGLESDNVVGGDVSKFGRGFLNVENAYYILKDIDPSRLPAHISLSKDLFNQMVSEAEKKVLEGSKKRMFEQVKYLYKDQDNVTSDVIISAMLTVMGSIEGWAEYKENSLSMARIRKYIQRSLEPSILEQFVRAKKVPRTPAG